VKEKEENQAKELCKLGSKQRKSLVLAAVEIFCLSHKCHHQKSSFSLPPL